MVRKNEISVVSSHRPNIVGTAARKADERRGHATRKGGPRAAIEVHQSASAPSPNVIAAPSPNVHGNSADAAEGDGPPVRRLGSALCPARIAGLRHRHR